MFIDCPTIGTWFLNNRNFKLFLTNTNVTSRSLNTSWSIFIEQLVDTFVKWYRKSGIILIQEYIYWKIGMQKNWYWMCRLIIAVNISFSVDYHLGGIFPTFNSNKFLCWKNENKNTIIYLHTLQHEQLIKHKPDIRCIWPPWQMTNLFHQQRHYHATVV